jgi:acetoin utilization protein AcuC
MATVALVAADALARYGFPDGHPFGPDRQEAFLRELRQSAAYGSLQVMTPRVAEREELEYFHDRAYVDLVLERSRDGRGYLDAGDTPAFRGVFEATSLVVGGTLLAAEELMRGGVQRAFIGIGGLHHASRAHAAGFCVFNDCGVVVEMLRRRHGMRRIAYVDIDAHHGDGVFYAYESDPDLLFADIHEDGRYLYPGTGAATETGTGAALGTKLNLPMLPGATDADFVTAWPRIEEYLRATRPEFILLSAERTASRVTRSRIWRSPRRPMPWPRPRSAGSQMSLATAAYSGWAGADTTGATSRAHGPAWWKPSSRAENARRPGALVDHRLQLPLPRPWSRNVSRQPDYRRVRPRTRGSARP